VRIRALSAIAGIEVRRTLAYRFDFWAQALAIFLSELGLVWFVWTAIYDTSGKLEIGGMTRSTAILYYVVVILSARLVRGNDLGEGTMSQEIYEGGLSRYLLYPEPYLALKYAQGLGGHLPAAIQFVVFGAAFPFLFAASDASIDVGSVARGIVSLAVANLLYFLLAFAIHSVAFWAENVWSLLVSLRFVSNLLGGLLVPLAAWPPAWHPVLDALPFRHLHSEPVQVILGRRSVAEWAANVGLAFGWCVLFFFVGQFVFRRGRLRYTGPGM
jgi:ABC-2 type transport system permease protein